MCPVYVFEPFSAKKSRLLIMKAWGGLRKPVAPYYSTVTAVPEAVTISMLLRSPRTS